MFEVGDKVYFTVSTTLQKEVLNKDRCGWLKDVGYGVIKRIMQQRRALHSHCVVFENPHNKEEVTLWFKPKELVKYQTNKREV